LQTRVSMLLLRCSVPSMAELEPGSARTAFEVFDEVSKLMLRMSLQALPVFLTIAASQIIARHM
jgi:hypothetical protein